ncbi:MAG: hypothetical protein ACFFEF_17145 [Candidatus Thorarchaeota archaeon]
MSRSDSLEVAASRAWARALSDFYHPPLPEPTIEYNESAASYFYIDSNNWTVHLNTAGVPLNLDSNDAEPYLRSICHHEIQHYLVCPFDGVTNGMMFAGARKHLPDPVAMFVCNIFADLVVDSSLLKRYPSLTHSRIQTSIHDSSLRTREHSSLWQLVVAAYRVMWGFPVPFGVEIDESTVAVAEKIIEIARNNMDSENKWPKATEEIAKVITEWLPKNQDPFEGSGVSIPNSGDASEQPITIPVDLDVIMGSPVEDRNGERVRKCGSNEQVENPDEVMERLAIEVEDRGGSLKDLEAVYILHGGTLKGEWIRFWYRAKVQGLLRFRVRHKRSKGATPLATEAWRLGDPIEELDVVQSLQTFPVLVPNMSTRRWMRATHYGVSHDEDLPDLLVVLDSSGSMTWEMGSKNLRGPYHTALVASLASVDTALRCSSQVAAINFSGSILRCEWTRERHLLEDTLLAYQGGGTVMPVKAIKELCDTARSKVMSVIITDIGVSNWGPFVKTVDSLSKQGHKLFIFHIGAKRGKISKAALRLVKAGGVVIPVNSVKDLPGLVVTEIQRTYLHST